MPSITSWTNRASLVAERILSPSISPSRFRAMLVLASLKPCILMCSDENRFPFVTTMLMSFALKRLNPK
jgi:hypothetical protein